MPFNGPPLLSLRGTTQQGNIDVFSSGSYLFPFSGKEACYSDIAHIWDCTKATMEKRKQDCSPVIIILFPVYSHHGLLPAPRALLNSCLSCTQNQQEKIWFPYNKCIYVCILHVPLFASKRNISLSVLFSYDLKNTHGDSVPSNLSCCLPWESVADFDYLQSV